MSAACTAAARRCLRSLHAVLGKDGRLWSRYHAQLQHELTARRLLPQGQSVLVAVSGGQVRDIGVSIKTQRHGRVRLVGYGYGPTLQLFPFASHARHNPPTWLLLLLLLLLLLGVLGVGRPPPPSVNPKTLTLGPAGLHVPPHRKP